MRSRFLALAIVAVAAVPAQATPYAGQYNLADTGAVGVIGADGATWSLQFVATEGSAAQSRSEQFLYVDLRRCAASSCVLKGHWVQPLLSSEVSITPTLYPTGTLEGHAKVSTVLAGRSLTIELASGNRFADGAEYPDPGRMSTSVSHNNSAYGAMRFGGLTCSIHGAHLSAIAAVDGTGNDAANLRGRMPAALPAGFLSGTRIPRC
jgi:hypothetical protein